MQNGYYMHDIMTCAAYPRLRKHPSFVSYDLKCFRCIYLMVRLNLPLQHKFLILDTVIWIIMYFYT